MNAFGQESSARAALAPVPDLSAEQSQHRLPGAWLGAIPVALIVIYAFFPTLNDGFVGWDDDQNFLENPYFRGLGPAQVKWAWTTFWVGVYQPLAWMLYGAQFDFCKLDPRGFHLTSLSLQVANAVVLYVLTVTLLSRSRPASCLESPWACWLSAGLATALFAVHPLRVEPVAWLSAQMYLPCALFSMLSVLAYLGAFGTDSSPRRRWLAASFVLFVAALLFHPVPVNLPIVLFILDVYPLRRFPDETGRWFGAPARRALWEKLPFVVASLVFMGLAIAARAQSPVFTEPYRASEGIAQACYGTWFYIVKTVFPLGLIAFYPLPKELNWQALPYNLSIFATLATTVGVFLLRRRWPGLLAAWLCYLVILAPNSGLVRNNSFTIVADRYSYMSMLGSVPLAASGFCWLWRTSPRWHRSADIGIVAIGLGVLVGLTGLTRNQCRTWLNSETLWAHALSHGANSSSLAHNNFGAGLLKHHKYEAAAEQFTLALRLDPGLENASFNMGAVLYAQGKYDEATAFFKEALRRTPSFVRARVSLGNVLFVHGKYAEAAAEYTEALRINPSNIEAHNNLGAVLSSQGKDEAALAHFTEALRLYPDYADAHYNLGKVLSQRKRYAEAQAEFDRTARD